MTYPRRITQRFLENKRRMLHQLKAARFGVASLECDGNGVWIATLNGGEVLMGSCVEQMIYNSERAQKQRS